MVIVLGVGLPEPTPVYVKCTLSVETLSVGSDPAIDESDPSWYIVNFKSLFSIKSESHCFKSCIVLLLSFVSEREGGMLEG